MKTREEIQSQIDLINQSGIDNVVSASMSHVLQWVLEGGKPIASDAVLDDSLPDYNEIDQVANDEANGIDWNESRYAGIYTDGFIAGALWMKRKIKK